MQDHRQAFRYFAALLAVCAPASASALDLRGVTLGDTCRQAAQRELTLGTRPLHNLEQMIQSGVVIFEASGGADQHQQVSYTCARSAGTVSLYSIAITTRREARAREAFKRARVAVVSRAGTPVDDSEFPEATEKLRQLRLKGLTATYAFVDWKSAKHEVVSLTLEKPQDSGVWSVTTTVSTGE